MGELEWFLRGAEAQIAREDELVLAQFKTVPPATVFTEYRAALDAAIAKHGKQCAVIHLAQPSRPKLDRSEMIEEFVKMMRDYDERIAAATIVILGEGFINAMLRSMAWLGITRVRPSFAIKILNDPEVAVRFIAQHIRGDEEHIAKVVRRFRFDADQAD